MTQPSFPPLAESVAHARASGKSSVADLLDRAEVSGRPLIQPRCGVGDHDAMLALLAGLEAEGAPDVLTVTIDAHTRLLRLDSARRALASDSTRLNGYPLITHGWRRGRELDAAVRVPLQVRHGSPDARLLFDATIAAGIGAFEGGGISYNVPYAKDVPLAHSLHAWQHVDRLAGEVTEMGLTVDRELFGTLTAVLMPPSICLAVTMLEAALAAAEGVRCVSIAYPQGGHPWQDLAALRAIPRLAARYLDVSRVRAHAVLHQFMGVFPTQRGRAIDLIAYGGRIAALGGVAKVVTKSPAEAHGIPTLAENVTGIAVTRAAMADAARVLPVDEAAVAEEQEAIEREVHELVDPILDRPATVPAIVAAFADGRLDVPFAASRHVRSAVVPCRDTSGAIRFAHTGGLPFGAAARRHNDECRDRRGSDRVLDDLVADVHYFSREDPRDDPLRRLAVPCGNAGLS